MNRRSILRLLGLAPIAAPAALAMPDAPALPAIDYAGLTADVQHRVSGLVQRDEFDLTPVPGYRLEATPDGTSRFVVDATAFYIVGPEPIYA